MTKNFLAIDLGATSGRAILGSVEDGKLSMREISRFPNTIERHTDGHCYWNFEALMGHILEALRAVAAEATEICSIGIDTWGVDVVFFDENAHPLDRPFSYRDPHTVGAPDIFFSRIPRSRLYGATGIQIMEFNTIFQLHTLRRNAYAHLDTAHRILFMPDAVAYMLTGEAVTETTIASTSQMYDSRTGRFVGELLDELGLSENQFGRWVRPGELVGTLSPAIQTATGMGPVPVIAVAGHDTASAVAAVPAREAEFAYLSSGTWSLMGIELPQPIINDDSFNLNFPNEGGVDGTVRFLKNICGMWLLERCREDWKAAGNDFTYPHLIACALESEPFRSLVNPDDASFANPVSMTAAIDAYCVATGQPVPRNEGEYTRCIFESLALRYRQVMDMIRSLSKADIKVLHIIGGGARNEMLNQFTANALSMPVEAGPAEATAIGNIMLQARAAGVAGTLADMRAVIADSFPTARFEPREADVWARAYDKFLKTTNHI